MNWFKQGYLFHRHNIVYESGIQHSFSHGGAAFYYFLHVKFPQSALVKWMDRRQGKERLNGQNIVNPRSIDRLFLVSNERAHEEYYADYIARFHGRWTVVNR